MHKVLGSNPVKDEISTFPDWTKGKSAPFSSAQNFQDFDKTFLLNFIVHSYLKIERSSKLIDFLLKYTI